MSAQLTIRVGRVVVRVPNRPQNHINGDAALKTLLAESKTLELAQAILIRCAVHRGIPEDLGLDGRVEDGWFGLAGLLAITTGSVGALETPGSSLPVR